MAKSDRRKDDDIEPFDLDAMELEPPDFGGDSGVHDSPTEKAGDAPAAAGEIDPDKLESYDLADPAPIAAPLPPKPKMKEGAAPAPPIKAAAPASAANHQAAPPAPPVSTQAEPEQPKDISPAEAARRRADARKRAAFLEAQEDERRRKKRMKIIVAVVVLAAVGYVVWAYVL